LGGVQAGDRLMAWDGEPIVDIPTWMGYMSRHEPGDVVTVTVDRGGERVDLDVELQPSGRSE
jgi:S1-C subfamily serine protease